MKKAIKTILTAMAVAMLFISCNADLDQKGIFESMMTSAPNADYTIKRFAGMVGEKFLIETNTGIETLSTDGAKTTLVKGLHATVRFFDDSNNILYYSVQIPGEVSSTLRYAALPEDGTAITESREASVKYKDIDLYIVASFYEDGEYYLLMQDKGRHYYIAIASKGSLSDSGNAFTFTDGNITECTVRRKEVEKDGKKVFEDITPLTTTYIGEGYYAVAYDAGKNQPTNWYLYNMDGREVIFSTDKPFTSRPMAVQNMGGKSYLFLQLQAKDGINLYTIEGTAISPVKNGENVVKHTISYLQYNQDIPMTEVDGKIYGCFGAKPFTFDGTTFADHESIGSGVVIIDMVHHTDGKYYAFSAENGLYCSVDGQKYSRVDNTAK